MNHVISVFVMVDGVHYFHDQLKDKPGAAMMGSQYEYMVFSSVRVLR